ncbi:hypothetical protein PR048_000238 [Dryococelus australis]|uniref:Uncharacterized protein n=1 Tax=Dryococelus australis TaxID=614101 RepID=A0ABQ9IE91_9NEOP|nr:hypothetical protein PR048_000238 [Dryococelus australis]
MKQRRDISEKTRRPAASFGTIPTVKFNYCNSEILTDSDLECTCENPGAIRTGIESGSPRWGASSVTTTPQRLLPINVPCNVTDGFDRFLLTPAPVDWQQNTMSLRVIQLLSAIRRGERIIFYWGINGERAIRLLASHQDEPSSIPGRLDPDFRKWESCGMMLLVGGFSRGSSFSPRLFIPALLHSRLTSPSSALKT